MSNDGQTLIAIRTHKWDEDAQRLFGQLHPVLGDDLVVAFHNRPEGLELPLPVVDLNDAWLAAQGLQHLPDWGWRCGDYFLYAVRQVYPQARHIWLIEPDVYFTGDPAEFFAKAGQSSADVLGVDVQPMPRGHRFSRGLPELPIFRSIFALSRFSGRAVDRLFPLRQAYAKRGFGPRFYANDEVFCFSHAMADLDMGCESMTRLMPEWLGPGQMQTDPDILVDTLFAHPGPGVFHPVRGHASFAGALAGRLVNTMAFVRHMAPSLAVLTAEERAGIALDVARRTQALLDGTAATHARRQRRRS
ncbi:component of SufBCD complex [Neogemmobacter tilapiae]|uniref:Uncharacterized protein n=1 Tax=Neogemmobacter tilapiae TaxID=875041 RepID=A0A918TFC5_9RHOB|nr:component of SufBCD complex [Gemmobacter tilapiae]GHC43632.1 hypothetical protein GCM10007315_00850 [Gemmobacter tilapiae]